MSTPQLTLGNPSTLSWTQDGNSQQISFSHKESALLVALAFFGEDGAPLDALRQLDMEITTTDKNLPHWQAWQDETPEKQLAQLNRLNVLKHRINERISESGLRINVRKRKSIWQLVWLDEPTALPVTGTAWTMEKPDICARTYADPNFIPKNLTTRQIKAFRTLLEHSPSFVSSASLTAAIDEPKASTKKISDMIYYMNQRLAGNFQISQNHKGEYRLLPMNTGNILPTI